MDGRGDAPGSGVLIMIDFPSSIGYAISRLTRTFQEAASLVTGDRTRVYFAFSELDSSPQVESVAAAERIKFSASRATRPEHEALGRFVFERNIQLVLALDLMVQSPACRTLRRAGVRGIVSYIGAPYSSRNHGLKLLAKRAEVAVRFSAPDLYVFESQSMRALGTEGRGLPLNRTMVIPTGIDPDVFSSARSDRKLLAEMGIGEDKTVVVFMGHMHRRKGVHVLMAAARIIFEEARRRDLHVLFLGNTTAEGEAYSKELLDGQSNVTFGGYRTDIPQLLASCDIGCIPSSGWDSFPMSALEMQAAGLPMVVSDLQGVPETILPGRTGLVVKAGDPKGLASALCELADDVEMRGRMSREAASHIRENLTRDQQRAALAAMLRNVAERHGVRIG